MTAPSRPLLGLPLLLLLAPACGDADADVAEAAPATSEIPQASEIRVEVARLEASDALLQLAVPAEVVGSRDALLASTRGGYVERVHVDEGDQVRAGQGLISIDRATASAQRDQAEAQLELAQAELARLEKLGDLATPQQLQQAGTQVKLAQASFDLADIAFRRAMISAPFDGVVAQVAVEQGEYAAPGNPVARVVQLDPVELSMSVSDRDVVGLREGMTVAVQTDANAEIHTGTLQAVSPAADLKTRSWLVKATVDNPDYALLPGMIARVALAEVLASETVVIPQEWLVTRVHGVGVFVVEEGVARWRPVRAGRVVRDQVVIEDGLELGETIVVNGQRALADGDPLLVARSGVCCEDGRAVF